MRLLDNFTLPPQTEKPPSQSQLPMERFIRDANQLSLFALPIHKVIGIEQSAMVSIGEGEHTYAGQCTLLFCILVPS
jgi:hypothetical protein